MQFRVLYREFLFRMVDLELLSAHAQGDSNRLLGQFASLLIFLSVLLTLPALGFGHGSPQQLVLAMFSSEHFLIATTMLVVGLFAVLSWDSTFPDRRDVLVLAPLPLRPRTLFLAKIAGVATALAVTVGALHCIAGLVWPIGLGSPAPAISAPALTWDPALPPASAAGLKAILDRDLVAPLSVGAMAPGTYAGLVIGVIKSGERRVFTYGTARPDSIYAIASVSKTLTALILARMIARGEVRLDQPVRELLPPGAVAKPAGDEITLLDLATHHSGLPSMPSNLKFDDQPNPGANYHPADLYNYLKRHGLQRPPDRPFDYSNLGFGVLGTALAERAGTGYADLLQREVAGPLGMVDTELRLSPAQEGRLIQGYNGRHNPVAPWDLDALAPAGAVRSTAADLLNFLDANLHPEKLPAELAQAVRISQTLHADVQPGVRVALAWVQDTWDRTYWHTGAVSGYTSYVFVRPERDYAGVILFNQPPDLMPFVNLVGEHVRERLAGGTAISMASITLPASSGFLARIRWFAVYWITMAAAGTFLFCCVLGVQGLAAQILPRRWFLRASSGLQLVAFAVIVGVYFTQPMFATPFDLVAAQGRGLLSWSPSYWFLGFMQQMSGSPALAPLARRAWIGLAAVVSVTAVAYALSYFRTLRKIVEEPDILPGNSGLRWLPPFGIPAQTAIVQFSIRTLMRSRQHRVILAFYLSIGFAMTVFLLRSPAVTERILDTSATGQWRQVSIPILASTLIMMIAWVVGTRVLFSMPLDLRANWVFRITARLDAPQYLVSARRSLLALSAAPVWLATAILCFSLWPWTAAAAHLAALGLFGAMLADLCMLGFRKIPFTCSYLPGKSQVHMVILGALLLLYFTLFAVKYERDFLRDPQELVFLLGALAVGAAAARWRAVSMAKSESAWLRFEDTPADEILVLGLTPPSKSTERTLRP